MAERVVNFRAGEKVEQQVPLSQITVSHNPRKSHRGLLELFHEKGAAHNAPEVRAEFVKHIDENFPHIRERAESFKSVGQLQAGLLRSFRAKIPGSEEYTERYGIAAGECRALAWGLIEAETGEPQRLRAVVEKLTVDEAFERGIAENVERTDMNPLDLAEAFNEMLTVRVNPATKVAELPDGSPNPLYDPSQPKGRPYSMRELAEKVKKDYHWVRSRAALVYLPDRERSQLERSWKEGRRNLTKFCKLACKLKTQATGEQPEPGDEGYENPDVLTASEGSIIPVQPERRRRVRSLKEVEALFDATSLKNTERLQALAEVMGISDDPAEALKIALEEREQRAEAAEIRAGREADREARRRQRA